eukprot:5624367-Amphidinium_carterae.1
MQLMTKTHFVVTCADRRRSACACPPCSGTPCWGKCLCVPFLCLFFSESSGWTAFQSGGHTGTSVWMRRELLKHASHTRYPRSCFPSMPRTGKKATCCAWGHTKRASARNCSTHNTTK